MGLTGESSRWARVEALFHEALKIDDEDRRDERARLRDNTPDFRALPREG